MAPGHFIMEEIMSVVRRGNKWCVVHAHPKKKGSKTDKPKGSIIKCYPGTEAGHQAALKMHRAIMAKKKK